MNPQQTIVQNTLYLNELDSSLKSLKKDEKFYLKIENNRVVVIKRHFSNLFQWLSAAVGTFFGRKEYDLGRIATVFTHELQAIQNAEKALPISQRIHAYVAGANRTLLCNTAVANVQLPKQFVVPVQTDRDTVIRKKNRINETLVAFDRLEKRAEFQKKGSLTEAVFTELRTALRTLWDKNEATLQEMTPPYLEAQHLIRAVEGGNEISKNAFRLMQLRALLEKAIAFAEKRGLPIDDLQRQWEHFHISTDGKEHYLKQYATPDYQLEDIQESILRAITPMEERWRDELMPFLVELDLID